MVFCQIAEGIDEATWMYHLHRGDYSSWFRDAIKDDFLADENERIERRADLAPRQTRQIDSGMGEYPLHATEIGLNSGTERVSPAHQKR